MENKNTITIIALAIVIIIITYFWYKSSSEKKSISPTNNTSNSVNTTNGSSNSYTSTNNPSTSTSSNQIKLKKVTPVYYQDKPSQAGYPNTYSGPVAGVTLPKDKVVTIVKIWTSQNGQGKFYETTENVPTSVLNKVTPHYFIKESDINA